MLAPFPEQRDVLSGGATAASHYLAEGLFGTGDIEILAVSLGAKLREDHIPYRRIIIPTGRYPLVSRFRHSRKLLRRVVEEFQPDIVHGQGMDIYGYAACDLPLAAIVTPHGLISQEIGLQATRMQDAKKIFTEIALCRPLLRVAKAFISISPFITNYLKSRTSGKIFTIDNVVPNKYFSINPRPERGRFLYVGRVRRLKDVMTAVRAIGMQRGDACSLYLAGAIEDATYMRELNETIEALGLHGRVSFLGIQPENSLIELMARANAIILPSLREVAPMVLQQAFAARVPVIASAVGGVPEMLNNGRRGALFRPGDVVALSKIISEFMHPQSNSADYITRGYQYACDNLTTEVVCSRTISAYQDCCKI